MVYTAEHPALAALEILSGWEVYTSLSGYHLYRCTFSEEDVLASPDDLDITDRQATRTFGDAWVREKKSTVLSVGSVVVPEATNYLLNPEHPDFVSVELEALGPFTFDARIEKLIQEAKS